MNQNSQNLHSRKSSSKRGPGTTTRPYPEAALVKDKTRYCVTIFKKSPKQVYEYWRDFKNLANFMKDVESIKMVSDKRSQWKVRLSNNANAEWTADITKDLPGEEISWKSTDDSEVQTTGTVWFMEATNGMGTVVGLNMDYHVPGGKLTELLAAFRGEDPKTLSHINLKRFKALLETGEVPTIEGQCDGREGEIK